MLIQVGTIAYRDKQTNNFAKSKPLYMKHSPELAESQKEFMQRACDMYLIDLLILQNMAFKRCFNCG